MLTSLVRYCPFFRSPSMWIYALFILYCHFSGVGKGKWVIVSCLINLPHLPSSLFTIYKLCVLPLLGRELFSPLRTVFCLDWGRMRQRVTKEDTHPSLQKITFHLTLSGWVRAIFPLCDFSQPLFSKAGKSCYPSCVLCILAKRARGLGGVLRKVIK